MRYRKFAFRARETALTALLVGPLFVADGMPRAAEPAPPTKQDAPTPTIALSDTASAAAPAAKSAGRASVVVIDLDGPFVIPLKPKTTPDAAMRMWGQFVGALDAGDATRALTFINESSRAKYSAAFTALGQNLGRLSLDWSDAEIVTVGPTFITVLVTDNADRGGTGHFVTMVLQDGRWVVDQL